MSSRDTTSVLSLRSSSLFNVTEQDISRDKSSNLRVGGVCLEMLSNTNYPTGIIRGLPQPFHTGAGTVPQIRPLLIPSTSFWIHYHPVM
jgi:hypothetical protein